VAVLRFNSSCGGGGSPSRQSATRADIARASAAPSPSGPPFFSGARLEESRYTGGDGSIERVEVGGRAVVVARGEFRL